MNTQLYLMGGLVEGRIRSDRELDQARTAKLIRRSARAERRAAHQR